MLPLYKDFQICGSEANPGLLFDKFPCGWSAGWHSPLENDIKKNFFTEFVCSKPELKYSFLAPSLKNMLTRQEKLARHLCSSDQEPTLYVKTDWRFVSGLGGGHPYETGFIWHRTLGVPYLPGSSVKGLLRAWTRDWSDKQNRVDYLFGPASDPNKGEQAGVGALIIFDALPTRPPKLEVDILNPHYGPYYESNGDKPPADYYNPVPVFFLTVAPNQPFRFCLAPRPGAGRSSDVLEGLELLQEALETLGAGGKTAVGYGIFEVDHKANEKKLPQEQRWRLELSRQKPKGLVNQFSKNWTTTKDKYGDDLDRFIKLVQEIHGDTIREWKKSTKKNEQKAYKKIYS